MPKGSKTKISLRMSPFRVVFLLCQIILIKIGELPVIAMLLLLKSARRILSFIPMRPLKKQKRGRPKKLPVFFFFRRFPLWAKITAITLIIGASGTIYTWVILSVAYELPTPTRLAFSDQPETSEFYDRSGKLLYRLYKGRNRMLVPPDKFPSYLIYATIAIEDRNFYKHNGIDLLAIARAVYRNFSNEEKGGASTITQQLVKNSLLTPERTYIRKIKEIILAVWAETIYSKDQILAMYLNNAPYGGVNWGVEAASQSYFGKPIQKLSLAESAYLAGLPASPSEYSPSGTRPDLGLARQKEVLNKMVENQFITPEQKDKALVEKLNFKLSKVELLAPHFVMSTKSYLENKYGPLTVTRGGLKVYTTLDLELQDQVQKIVSEEVGTLASLNVSNGAAMVTDPKTGQILAMAGSRDYNYPGFGNYNVTTALRQPGSAIKPITYVTAFKKGYSPGNTVLDTPVVFSDQWGNSYAPVNYDGKFHGPVSIRTALGSSLNVPAVRVLATIGVDPVIQTAKDLGITTFTDPKSYGLSLTLGGAAVKMVEMMSVYGAFSQLGVVHPITPILKVVDSKGNVLEEYTNKGQQVIQPELAYMITNILADNQARTLAFGANSLLNLRGVAVKTGTSDWKKDNWAFGFTPNFVVGAWVGNNDDMPMEPSLASGITGATPIWNRIMRGLLVIDPAIDFQKPPGIVDVTIDGRKDIAAAGILPKALVRAKSDKEKTIYFDAFSSFATSTASLKDISSN